MGVPFVSSDGFVGRRRIIDDYFEAAETLYCGDPVTGGINDRQTWRADADGDAKRAKKRCVGIVYTGPEESVGDTKVASGEEAPVVTEGITKVKVDGAVGVGDLLVASTTMGKVHVDNAAGAGEILGKSMDNGVANDVIDMLVALG